MSIHTDDTTISSISEAAGSTTTNFIESEPSLSSDYNENAHITNVDNDSQNGSSTLYIIIGAVIGVLVIIIGIIVIILYRRKRQEESSCSESEAELEQEVIPTISDANDLIATVNLFTTDVADSDPFNQDFEEFTRFV